MAEKGVKVFGMWASPMTVRVKGVQYEYIDKDLANLVTTKIPVLVHDGNPMAESTTIVEYIDKTWKDGYSFMPADPYERAQARFWSRFANEKCNPALYPIFTTAIGEAQRKVVHEAQQCLKTLETALKGKKFFGGDSVGYLDIYHRRVVRALAPGHRVGVRRQHRHRGVAPDEGLAVNVIKATLPDRHRLLAVNKARREQLLSSAYKTGDSSYAFTKNSRTP